MTIREPQWNVPVEISESNTSDKQLRKKNNNNK